MALIHQSLLTEFLTRLDAACSPPVRLYLIGESTQVYEGWRRWTDQIELATELPLHNRAAFEQIVRQLEEELETPVLQESPAEIIPLPADYRSRARRIEENRATGRQWRSLELYHFDPYSVAFRYIARGSEPDYHLVLNYLKHDWITVEEMERLLNGLLPQFTQQTIQQDPAEFKRRYKGLLQMWRSLPPGTTHRHTPT